MPGEAAAWVREAMRYGVTCAVVEGHRPTGRCSRFEDSVAKSRLRLTAQSITLENGTKIQLKEIKAVEAHQKRPSSPVFRTARDDVPSKLVTLRWNQTGKHLQTGQYLHLLFPTSADARTFHQSMTEVHRFGVHNVVNGMCGEDVGPAQWQIDRVRERFLRMRRNRLARPSHASADAAGTLAEPQEVPADLRQEGEESALTLLEDGEMHERWREALRGRSANELSPEELRPLLDGGLPLKYRHQLWRLWLTNVDAGNVDELEARVDDDSARQVDLDIPRTNPKWLTNHDRSKVRRLLRAYAARNPSIGYCQGMNFLAMVFVLLGFNEATAFAGLCYLVEVVCPGYHGRGLEGYMRDAAVLEVLVHHLLTHVHQLLEDFEVPLMILALDHFVALGARNWPFEAVVPLWDLILLEGSPAVFASFLACLELYLPAAAKVPPGSVSQGGGAQGSADVMEEFKQAVLRGACHEPQRLLAKTREWLPLVSLSLIERLRDEISAEGER